ncbi:MAG: hypothetical protein ABR517_07955 [Thermoanaerobaculia bacterium]
MSEPADKPRTMGIWIALAGIAIEMVAIWLLRSGRIAVPVAMPILIVGMFMAFVPAFMLLRSKRR